MVQVWACMWAVSRATGCHCMGVTDHVLFLLHRQMESEESVHSEARTPAHVGSARLPATTYLRPSESNPIVLVPTVLEPSTPLL